MADVPLALIRILRRLPHSSSFDRHLTDCAAHAVWYLEEDPRLPRLTVRHVLKLDPLPPSFFASGLQLVSDHG